MTLSFDHPARLVLLLLCLPPLLGAGWRWRDTPSLTLFPLDRVSRIVDLSLRLLAALPIAAAVFGLAGLHAPGQRVAHGGRGAHIAIVLDRSLSMDEAFALRGERGQESKSEAASRMLSDFVTRRPHDSFALVAFSTAPIPVMPMTSRRQPILAAIGAMRLHALANTDIGGGIAMGLQQLALDPEEGARVILLVSDGAGAIPPQTRDLITSEARRLHIHLYYLYLRAGDDPPLADSANGESDLDRPAGLSVFFQTLGVPYLGFEARAPDAVQRAASRIEALETQPLIYFEQTQRQDLDAICYRVAAILLALGILAHLAERDLHAPDAEASP